jgi:hypothetical protein
MMTIMRMRSAILTIAYYISQLMLRSSHHKCSYVAFEEDKVAKTFNWLNAHLNAHLVAHSRLVSWPGDWLTDWLTD